MGNQDEKRHGRKPVRSPIGFGKTHLMTGASLYVDLREIDWAPSDHEERWAKWQTAKVKLDEDYRQEQLRRIEEIGRIVAKDLQQIALDDLRAAADARARASALEEEAVHKAYLAQVAAAVAVIADRKFAQRVKRAKKAQRSIDRDLVRAERRRFLKK